MERGPSPADYGSGGPPAVNVLVHFQLERTLVMATNCLEYGGMSRAPFGYATDGGPLAKRVRSYNNLV